MSGAILATFQKNYEKLCQEYQQYQEFHDTMSVVIPNILELLDSLFLEEHVKAAPNYDLLVEDYLNAIKVLVAPENYEQIKLESQLPDIYDAPSARRGKVKKIKKLVRESKIVPTIQPRQAVTPVPTTSTTPPAPSVIDPYAPKGRRKAPGNVQKKVGSYPLTGAPAVSGPPALLPVPKKKIDPLPIKIDLNKTSSPSSSSSSSELDLESHLRKQEERDKKDLTMAARATIASSDHSINYCSPLEALQEKTLTDTSSPITSLPDRIYISLPDPEESQAILMNDGRIIDIKNGLQRGEILPTGKIILDKKEYGSIGVVDPGEGDEYFPVTHSFGRWKETPVSYRKA